jgi:hypothetical protein
MFDTLKIQNPRNAVRYVMLLLAVKTLSFLFSISSLLGALDPKYLLPAAAPLLLWWIIGLGIVRGVRTSRPWAPTALGIAAISQLFTIYFAFALAVIWELCPERIRTNLRTEASALFR